LLWLIRPVWAFDTPIYQNWVTDQANIYSPEFEEKLNNSISAFEEETGNEIAVLTISKLPEASIEEYGVEVFEKWGVGKEGEDNGVLVVIAKEDREMRIEVGYGLEGKITDSMAGRIIRDEMTPQFKLENYELGTLVAVEKIMGHVKGDVVESANESVPPKDFGKNIIVLILGFIFLTYTASFLGRSREFVTGGIIGFLIGLIFSGLIVGIVLGVFGLILDLILSSNFKKLKTSGKPTGFLSSKGGFKSSGTSSSGGFGGFGGGSSGGGGASGKW
jgi:uncharacterized protein